MVDETSSPGSTPDERPVHIVEPTDAGTGNVTGSGSTSPPPWVPGVVALILALGIGTVLWMGTAGEGPDGVITGTTGTTTSPDEATAPDQSVAIPDQMEAVAASWSDGRFWVLVRPLDVIGLDGRPVQNLVISLDETGALVTETVLPTAGTSITAGGEGVWVTGEGTLTRLDRTDGTIVAEIPTVAPEDLGTARLSGRRIDGVAAVVAGDSVWVLDPRGALAEVGVTSDTMSAVTVLRTSNPRALFTSPGAVWVAPPTPNAPMVRFDTTTGTVTTDPVAGLSHRTISGLVDGDDLYLTGDRMVSRVDLATLAVVDMAGLESLAAIFVRIDDVPGLLVPGGFIPVGDQPGIVEPVRESNWSPGTETFAVETETWTVRPDGGSLERLTASPG